MLEEFRSPLADDALVRQGRDRDGRRHGIGRATARESTRTGASVATAGGGRNRSRPSTELKAAGREVCDAG